MSWTWAKCSWPGGPERIRPANTGCIWMLHTLLQCKSDSKSFEECTFNTQQGNTSVWWNVAFQQGWKDRSTQYNNTMVWYLLLCLFFCYVPSLFNWTIELRPLQYVLKSATGVRYFKSSSIWTLFPAFSSLNTRKPKHTSMHHVTLSLGSPSRLSLLY